MPAVRPMGGPGRIGLIIPPAPEEVLPAQASRTSSTTQGNTPGTTAGLAAFFAHAEGAGANALWAVDHLFWRRPTLECVTTLAVAATATAQATLGTCVLQLPLRRPAAVAKQATALQLLSGGRFVLGVGVGSHRGEYEMAGARYAGRGQAADRGIDELRRTWATAGHADLAYPQEPAGPPVPVWIGGSSPAAQRRAARADGWVPMFLSPGDYADGLHRVRLDATARGRNVDDVTAAVVVTVSVGNDASTHQRGAAWLSALYGIPPKAFDRHLISGPSQRCAERLAEYYERGADHVAVMVAGDGALDQFAELVGALPAVAGRAFGGRRPDLVEIGA